MWQSLHYHDEILSLSQTIPVDCEVFSFSNQEVVLQSDYQTGTDAYGF